MLNPAGRIGAGAGGGVYAGAGDGAEDAMEIGAGALVDVAGADKRSC